MDATLVIQSVGLGLAMAGGFWKFSDIINKRFEHSQKNQSAAFTLFTEQQKKSFDRVYERMDQRQDEIEKTFVRTEVHNMSLQNQSEKVEIEFKHTIQVFELKMEALTKAVNALINKSRPV